MCGFLPERETERERESEREREREIEREREGEIRKWISFTNVASSTEVLGLSTEQSLPLCKLNVLGFWWVYDLRLRNSCVFGGYRISG